MNEAEHIDHIEEALWWVERYVSGSLNDPDWDYGEPTHLNIDCAMAIVGRYVGNQYSVGKPLSRYIVVDNAVAKRIMKSKKLPSIGLTFQSFSAASPKETLEIGREIVFGAHDTPGKIELVVTAVPPANDVLFGFADIAKSVRKPGVTDLFNVWNQDWSYQNEVIVRVIGPLVLQHVRTGSSLSGVHDAL
jgi:hypothetical protein